MRSTRRGRFIVIEGLDGAGTTTQSRELVRRLAKVGIAAELTAEPSAGPIGALIRQVLSGRIVGHAGGAAHFDRAALALLFAADRLDHVREEVIPRLTDGRWVVSDRYALSSLAYQGLDLPMSYVADLNARAPKPDLTFFLDVRPEVSLRRRAEERAARDLFEDLATQRKVAKGYQAALKLGPSVIGPVVVVDGTGTVGAVADQIGDILAKRFKLGRPVSGRSVVTT